LILSTLAIVINLFLAYGLLRAERDPIYQILYLHDLAAVQTSTGQDVIPSEFKNTNFRSEDLIKSLPADIDYLFVTARYMAAAGKVTVDNVEQLYGKLATSRDGPLVYRYDAPSLLALRQAWLRAMKEHPWVLIRHRISVLAKLLGNANFPYYPMGPALKLADTHLPGAGVFAQLLNSYHAAAAATPIFSGWFFVLLHLLALALCLLISTTMRAVIIALVCSGLANIAIFAVIGVSAEVRYLLWTSISAFTAIALLLPPHAASTAQAQP
jgi:hypothetical protein